MPELPHIKFTIAEVERMIEQLRAGHSGLVLHALKGKHTDTLIKMAVAPKGASAPEDGKS